MMKPLMTKNISTPEAPTAISQSGAILLEIDSDSSNEWWNTTSVAAIPRSI
jgi:hypothetical protein